VLRVVPIVWLLLALAACTDPTPPPAVCTVDKVADLPARLVRGGVLVPATLDHMAVQMEVDTGATSSTVTPTFAGTRGLQPDPHRHTAVHGVGGQLVTRNTLVWSFEVGSQIWSAQSFATAPLARDFQEEPPVAGLLGADYLSDFDVELDLPHGRMTLWQVHGCEGDFALHGVPHWSMKLRRSSPARMIATVQLEDQKLSALIDWGANETVLKEAVALRLGVTPAMLDADPAGESHGADKNAITAHRHRFAELRIGNGLFRHVGLAVAPIQAANVDMLLGIDYARTRHVWLSYATQQMFVAASPRATQ
jgi:predicted aspartyl protease